MHDFLKSTNQNSSSHKLRNTLVKNMEAFVILVKLLCAHLCSDFIFQTDDINKGKHKSGIFLIYRELMSS